MSSRTNVRSQRFKHAGNWCGQIRWHLVGGCIICINGGGGFSPNFALRTILLMEFFSFFIFCEHVVWRLQRTVKIGFFLFIRLFDYIKTCYEHAVTSIRTMGKIKRLPTIFFSFNPYSILPKQTLSDLVVFFLFASARR